MEKPTFDGKPDRDILIDVAIRQAIHGEKLESIDKHLGLLNGTCAMLMQGYKDHDQIIQQVRGALSMGKYLLAVFGATLLGVIFHLIGWW